MQARSWPGAPADDKNDFWCGLLPDPTYVRVFKSIPDFHSPGATNPSQAQPEHVGKDAGCAMRGVHTVALQSQRDAIERLMSYMPAAFDEEKKANMRRLLDSLGCNLEASNPVAFDWDEENMDFLYNQGDYVDHVPAPSDESAAPPNLFDDAHLLDAVQHATQWTAPGTVLSARC